MVSEYRHYAVHTHFRCLFHEPLVTGDVLGGTHGHMQLVAVGAEVLLSGIDTRLDSLCVSAEQGAAVKRAAAVYHGNRITGTVAQHLHAMSRLLLVKKERISLYVRRIKEFHHLKSVLTNSGTSATFTSLISLGTWSVLV